MKKDMQQPTPEDASVSTSGGGLVKFHLLAIVTSVIWGTTFASTKVLIHHGLTPATIMCIRFLLAYIGMLFFMRSNAKTRSWRDEGLLALAGITGGSLYFLTENTALRYTTSANVGILVAVIPLATALLTHFLMRGEPFRRNFLYGGVLALIGVSMVMLNGHFVLELNPLGDVLTLMAVVCWAFYGILLKKLEHYPTAFVTRKVFFYGIVTILPVFLFEPFTATPEALRDPTVSLNLLYLGLIASLLCYLSWSFVVKKLGVVVCTNYLYLNPVAALCVSAFILKEPFTPIALAGSVLILVGVYISERNKHLHHSKKRKESL